MENLVDALQQQQAYARLVLSHYRAIGPGGAFGAAMIERSLQLADKAAASGDVVEMLRAYHDLKSIK